MLSNVDSDLHILECKNISFLSTINRGSWFSKLYTPPIIGQFLKDINLEAVSGEVHAVLGVAGSGKSTLLEAISCHADGDITGTVLLDKNLLSRPRFNQLCSFVSFRQQYPNYFTIRSLLYYSARICLGGSITDAEIERRMLTLMQEFDILCYGHERLGDLSESARRRTVIVMALLRDPILLIVDDPIRHLEPLSSFQMISLLNTYARRHNRIILISMRSPRSDIYQLLQRVTILFYGEVFYSGRTKELPSYFRDAGFPCPNKENPAVYYLTLATVDRENPERFAETQEQALRLVDNFREFSSAIVTQEWANRESYGIGSTVALCYLGRPSMRTVLWTLSKRSLISMCSSVPCLIFRILMFPLLAVFLSMFSINLLSGSWTIPHSASNIFQFYSLSLIITSAITTLAFYAPLRDLSFIDHFEGLYNQLLSAFGFLSVTILLDISMVAMATTIFMWMVNLTLPLIIFRTVCTLLLLVLSTQMSTMASMMFLTNHMTIITATVILAVTGLVYGGGIIRAFSTMPDSWVYYGSYLNPLRYINYMFLVDFITRLPVKNCIRSERSEVDTFELKDFCRWTNGSIFRTELYPESFYPSDYWTNAIFIFLLFLCSLFVMIIAHIVPKSRRIVNKFRYGTH